MHGCVSIYSHVLCFWMIPGRGRPLHIAGPQAPFPPVLDSSWNGKLHEQFLLWISSLPSHSTSWQLEESFSEVQMGSEGDPLMPSLGAIVSALLLHMMVWFLLFRLICHSSLSTSSLHCVRFIGYLDNIKNMKKGWIKLKHLYSQIARRVNYVHICELHAYIYRLKELLLVRTTYIT